MGAQGGTDQTPVATRLVVGNLSIVNTGIKGRVRSSIIKIPGLILHNCYPYLFIQQELIKADPNIIQMQSLQTVLIREVVAERCSNGHVFFFKYRWMVSIKLPSSSSS